MGLGGEVFLCQQLMPGKRSGKECRDKNAEVRPRGIFPREAPEMSERKREQEGRTKEQQEFASHCNHYLENKAQRAVRLC